MKKQEISAEYIDHSGSDLMVANAARTSFGKESDWDWDGIDRSLVGLGDGVYNGAGHKRILKPADAKLIHFLASGFRTGEWAAMLAQVRAVAATGDDAALSKLLRDYKRKAQHWAPFGHPHLTLRMTLPIFLARQFVKHQVGGVWSEESRRYMSSEPSFWFPKELHGRPDDIKQGADGVHGASSRHLAGMRGHTEASSDYYLELVADGVAPEEARAVLPLNAMTSVTWTGSLLFWSRVVSQRVDSHAQLAAQQLGRAISDIVAPHFPVSWEALTQ